MTEIFPGNCVENKTITGNKNSGKVKESIFEMETICCK
jgi:hypothetical protein